MKTDRRPDISMLLRDFNCLSGIGTVRPGHDDPAYARSPRPRKKITDAISHHREMAMTIREHIRRTRHQALGTRHH